MLLAMTGHHGDGNTWLAQRQRSQPYASRRLNVHVRIAPEEARFEIAHEGPPLVLAEGPPAENPALEDPTDRSLILMRAFMDEVSFAPDGRCVALTKRKADD
jgi:hypothetical protein